MTRKRHRVSHVELLEYALEGASTEYGTNTGNPMLSDEWFDWMEKDIKEIERRLKLAKIAEAKKEAT